MGARGSFPLIFSFEFGLMDLGYVFLAIFWARIYLAMFISSILEHFGLKPLK
jgi:hypothetical protein